VLEAVLLLVLLAAAVLCRRKGLSSIFVTSSDPRFSFVVKIDLVADVET
jgi:hypothetical protein